jgi:predicted CopG family antitoxin
MPPRNYSNITVRREVREELERLRGELGVRDFSDLLALLVARYREYTSVTSKLVEQLTSISSKVDELLTRVSSTATSASSISANGRAPATSNSSTATSISSSKGTGTHATKGSKKTAIEVLREAKVRCASEMRSARNPEAVIDKMRASGAVVVRTDEDVCAVDPEYWDLFKRRLNEVKTPDDREVLSRLKDEKMKKLFQLLRKAGALYLDNKTREWVYDYSYIDEPKGDRGREEEEEETPVDWELT